MPARSSISLLPKDVREEFEKRLVAGGFANYSVLSYWLKAQGYEISRSAAQRHGQKFESRIAALKIASEQAVAIASAMPDEEGKMGDALTRLCQEKALGVLLKMEDAKDMSLPSLGRMIADLNRAGISQKKWMAEAREKARSTAEEIVKTARGDGLSEQKAEEIRKKILGIV